MLAHPLTTDPRFENFEAELCALCYRAGGAFSQMYSDRLTIREAYRARSEQNQINHAMDSALKGKLVLRPVRAGPEQLKEMRSRRVF